jgi:hypothetical protein
MALVENEDLKRWLLLDDETIVRAAAVAVGMEELGSLLAHYSAAKEWVEGAKVAWVMGGVSTKTGGRKQHAKVALSLLEQAGSATKVAQQLELDMRGALIYQIRTGPEKEQNMARIQALMAGNKSLRMNPLGIYFASILPKVFALFGCHPKMWDAGAVATQDTALAGFRLQASKGVPLFAKAVEEAVGARKQHLRLAYELMLSGQYMGARSTDEMAEIHQQLLDAKWGKDGSILTTACMAYRFDRHWLIAQGLEVGYDTMISQEYAQHLAEHCGDVQQMVQLFEKQLGTVQELLKSGMSDMGFGMFFIYGAPSCTGLELSVLHPFGKDMAALLQCLRRARGNTPTQRTARSATSLRIGRRMCHGMAKAHPLKTDSTT